MSPTTPTPAPPPGPSSSSSLLSLTIPQATRLLTTFSHFLTVCIHNILYYRNLYPATTFLASRAYNLPVHQSRHPAVCAWVRDAVEAARAQIARGAVERLAVVVYDAPGAVMERWMFDLARFPAVWKGVPERDGGSSSSSSSKGKERAWGREQEEDDEVDDAGGVGVGGGGGGGGDAGPADQAGKVNWVNVDEQLRAAVRRLAYASEKIAPLPDGCTFTIAVELRDEAEAPIGHPQPWVPTQPNLQTASRDQQAPGRDVGGAKTTAVRAVEAGPLFFECWVEEGKAKLELPSTVSSNE